MAIHSGNRWAFSTNSLPLHMKLVMKYVDLDMMFTIVGHLGGDNQWQDHVIPMVVIMFY